MLITNGGPGDRNSSGAAKATEHSPCGPATRTSASDNFCARCNELLGRVRTFLADGRGPYHQECLSDPRSTTI